ncbi:MAG: Carbonate dehydratase [Gammaproteobacteria bacterium]|jgi:carbonic anhydrase|nr:Carbonate dehydratase [Gammaproteobacteria bacterium]
MKALDRLKAGYQKFAEAYFSGNDTIFKELVTKGQRPEVLIIGCCDSRVSPSIITQAEPGELFTIRNVANLVPPYTCEEDTYHGVSAAIEFAVRHLEVEHIVVLGHSQCGGIRALMENSILGSKDSFISTWVSIAEAAKNKINTEFPDLDLDAKCHLCEQQALQISLNNLLSFPWVKSRVDAKKLYLHAWHFDLSSGLLTEFTPETHKAKILYHYAK